MKNQINNIKMEPAFLPEENPASIEFYYEMLDMYPRACNFFFKWLERYNFEALYFKYPYCVQKGIWTEFCRHQDWFASMQLTLQQDMEVTFMKFENIYKK